MLKNLICGCIRFSKISRIKANVSFKETNNNTEPVKQISDFALDMKLYHYDEDVTSVKVQLLWNCPENRLEEIELGGELLTMLGVYGCVDHTIWLDVQQ